MRQGREKGGDRQPRLTLLGPVNRTLIMLTALIDAAVAVGGLQKVDVRRIKRAARLEARGNRRTKEQ